MGKFSDYVGTIKQQTDSLRDVVTAKSGVDCSKMSISECAGVVENLEVTSQEEARYIRPGWYPDIEDIVMKAPDIVKDGVTYYPVVSVLLDDSEISSPFYRTNATSSSAINYYRGTGCDAYIFSDDVDNNVDNANENTLQVGNTIEHTWNKNKDISGDNGYNVRWVVYYAKSLTNDIEFHTEGYYPCIEVVVRRGQYSSWRGTSRNYVRKLRYFKVCKDVKMGYNYVSSSNLFQHSLIEEFVNESSSKFEFKMCFAYTKKLKRIINNGVIVFDGCFDGSSIKNIVFDGSKNILNNIDDAYCQNTIERITIDQPSITGYLSGLSNLKEINLINTESITNTYLLYCQNGVAPLDYVKIPSTLKTWNTHATYTLPYFTYVELFNDFNISGVNLTGQTLKKIQWLKDLCVWLKDRTGDTANTMIIGAMNLDNANNIYLTFNPNDKRDITFDGVTAETEGAVSIVDFITNQLNWTLS